MSNKPNDDEYDDCRNDNGIDDNNINSKDYFDDSSNIYYNND